MNYVFKTPSFIKIVHSKVTCCHGGGADGTNKIYLYGFEANKFRGTIDEILVWSDIIQHEHLHIILNKLRINPTFHHPIMDKMGCY